jgi:soluble lytic murein transglycosylase-like protein
MSHGTAESAPTPSGGLGIRGTDERRHDNRRRRDRHGRERRRGDRRRAGMRTLLLTAAALSAPHAAKVRASYDSVRPGASPTITDMLSRSPVPAVSVSIDSVIAPADAGHAYDDIIQEAAEKYRLDPVLIRSVMQAESAFNAMAVSPVGALGLMQLMPEVAAELGAEDPMDPRQNIMAGSLYLRRLLDAHRGNIRLALASYNAGPGAVAKYGRIPPFKETRDYVKKISGLLADARAAANDH